MPNFSMYQLYPRKFFFTYNISPPTFESEPKLGRMKGVHVVADVNADSEILCMEIVASL